MGNLVKKKIKNFLAVTGLLWQFWTSVPSVTNAVNYNTSGLSSELKTQVKLRQQYTSTSDNFEDEAVSIKSENSNRLFFKGDEKINDEFSESSNTNAQQKSINNLNNIQNVSYYLGFCCLIYIKHMYFQDELSLNDSIPELDISQISIKDKIPISISGFASSLGDKFVLKDEGLVTYIKKAFLKLRAGSTSSWNEVAIFGLVVILAIYGPEPLHAFLNKVNPRIPKISTLGPEGYNTFTYPTQKNNNSYLSNTKTVDQCSTHDSASNPIQTQVSGFVKDGKIDLHKCYDEVMRRAKALGCDNWWHCEFERFASLARENGIASRNSAREAISILNGEMLGFYKNARREEYGLNIKGPDFRVEGLGEFKNITHVEVKNPVGSAIKIANGQRGSISKQGKKIGAKIVYQQNYWSNTTKTSELENINPTASLPQSPNNVLGAVDNFDVPSSEKAFMEGSVLNGSKNNTNIIFLNNN